MRLILALPPLAAALPAAAQIAPVPQAPADAKAAADGVVVYFPNESDTPRDAQPPATLRALAADGTPLDLVRVDAPPGPIAPGGFARLLYRPVTIIAAATPPPPLPSETETLAAAGTASAVLDRFAPYRPVYGVVGAGDSGAKLQVSFAFQPFAPESALAGLRFGYTQTMFWRIDLDSGPFTATNYSPELWFEQSLDERTVGAIGYAHDSNGRGPAGSIDVNRIYARVTRRFALGEDWYAEVTPQAWLYFGRQGAALDLDRYWGYTALAAAVAQVDGIKLQAIARGNPGTGKGAVELFASYPLARIGGGLGFYGFAQGFTGQGEALDRYRVRDTHLRLGIALTR
ncbi:phospholipase [Sphingomonas baiyangensis]|uniref:Phospholipase A1 n=2 Tax=Sphingomonas baiyangensis TaxID=2572576 RepID=A0A4U1L8T4_9SPHN|nr:phospholipase [Sphingomonas baiyangensis]